uniref:FimD/PapC C-terminal domain-containing protein n=1 Tax=Escherichia coli TaxID=562 RepID=UPI000A47AE9B
ICSPMTSLKTSIKTITYLSDIGCLEIQGASLVTVIPTHGAIARATFNAQIGGKVLMTLKYGNKSVPFGAIVTHGENKNGSIVAENGQVYLTGLPQSGQLQVSWGKDKNSNCIVEYKLPEVSPGTLLNQQTAICR